jgi:GFO/IDH/MocA oxidoreductase family protein
MRAGGGNLLERGSHHLDLIRAVAGEVTSVQAAGSRIRLARSAGDDAGDIDDALTIMLSLASGALATVVIAWTRAGQPGSYGLDIVASEATLRLALDPDFTVSGVSRGEPVSLRAAAHPFGRSVRCFLEAVRDRDPGAVACAPGDAAATLAVAVAAEEALRTARAVPVEALLPGSARLPRGVVIKALAWTRAFSHIRSWNHAYLLVSAAFHDHEGSCPHFGDKILRDHERGLVTRGAWDWRGNRDCQDSS